MQIVENCSFSHAKDQIFTGSLHSVVCVVLSATVYNVSVMSGHGTSSLPGRAFPLSFN